MSTNDWSLKRLAWAYGCAKAGSEEEQRLKVALISRVGVAFVRDQYASIDHPVAPCPAQREG